AVPGGRDAASWPNFIWGARIQGGAGEWASVSWADGVRNSGKRAGRSAWSDSRRSPWSGTAAAAIAAINSLGNLGGLIGPNLVGWLKDSTGSFEAGLYAMAGCTLISAIVTHCGSRAAQTGRADGFGRGGDVISRKDESDRVSGPGIVHATLVAPHDSA